MKLRNIFKKFTTKKALLSLAVIAAVAVPLAVHGSQAKAGYGPTRTRVYDWNVDADKVGAQTPTLDSFINSPAYGDERNLTRIAPVVSGQNAVDADFSKENVTATAGNEYWVRVYVHNDANQTLNDAEHNYVGVATNTKVRVAIAQGQANGIDVMGYVSADNAVDPVVYDTGTLVNDTQKFSVSYVPGSASILNQAHLSGTPLSDDIAGANGVQIGYDQMDGKLPACFQYSAYVFVKVKVNAPNISIAKTERQVKLVDGKLTGQGDFADTLAVKPGDKVSYRLYFKNNGSDYSDNVTVRDTLPAGLTLDPGTITLVSPLHPTGMVLNDNALANGGQNVGSYAAGADSYIYFRAIVGNPADDTCKIVNTAYVHGDNSPETSDTATLTYDQALCKKPPVVSYTCDLLKVVQDTADKHKATFTFTTSQDATTKVSTYVIDFGDGSTPFTTNQNPYTYTYAKEGTYNVVGKVNFVLADSTPKNGVAGNKCIGTVTISSKPPVTPPTVLPNTGAGSTIAIFGATTVLGAFLYRMRALKSLR
ncbi:MAG: exported protein of unknown function [Candidatus Saccharibacteria bacterium]|nr:exported protein of unknown function [Candidatus Saccharibacteria bacterium]